MTSFPTISDPYFYREWKWVIYGRVMLQKYIYRGLKIGMETFSDLRNHLRVVRNSTKIKLVARQSFRAESERFWNLVLKVLELKRYGFDARSNGFEVNPNGFEANSDQFWS